MVQRRGIFQRSLIMSVKPVCVSWIPLGISHCISYPCWSHEINSHICCLCWQCVEQHVGIYVYFSSFETYAFYQWSCVDRLQINSAYTAGLWSSSVARDSCVCYVFCRWSWVHQTNQGCPDSWTAAVHSTRERGFQFGTITVVFLCGSGTERDL